MDTLKMKFKLNTLEFEIEGNEETVKSEFSNFQKFVSSELLNKLNITDQQPLGRTPVEFKNKVDLITDVQIVDNPDIPILKEVVKRDLPNTEVDWVLIYAFYASNMGENTFTEKNLKDLYETTGRKTDNRSKKFSDNLKSLLNKVYIKIHNDTEYILKEKGKAHALLILSGKSISKSSKRAKPKSSKESEKENKNIDTKKKKTKSGNNIDFTDLQFSSEKIALLTSYYESKTPTKQTEEVLVFTKWFFENMERDDISIEELNYLFSICSKVPTALGQVLINMKGSNLRWLSNSIEGKVKLTSIGESYVLNKLPKKDK